MLIDARRHDFHAIYDELISPMPCHFDVAAAC